jgi:hypothetical protein
MIRTLAELCVCTILLLIIVTFWQAIAGGHFGGHNFLGGKVTDCHALPLCTANYETAEGVSLPRSTLYTHYLKHCNESRYKTGFYSTKYISK